MKTPIECLGRASLISAFPQPQSSRCLEPESTLNHLECLRIAHEHLLHSARSVFSWKTQVAGTVAEGLLEASHGG